MIPPGSSYPSSSCPAGGNLPDEVPIWAHWKQRSLRQQRRAVHEPHRRLAIVVLPEDIGLGVVVVELASPHDVPVGPGLRPDRRRRRSGRSRPVHQPHRGLTVVVLPQNVALDVAVEVAAPCTCQLGPGLARPRPRRSGCPVHQPDGGLAVVVLPQDVALAVAVEVAGVDHMPGRARIGPDRSRRRSELSRSSARSRPGRCRSARGCRPCRRR